MNWWGRFLIWGTVFLWISWLGYSTYSQFLARSSVFLLSLFGLAVEIRTLDVLAPVDLALFTAMALASRKTPMRRRLLLTAAGDSVLAVLDVTLVTSGVVLSLGFRLPASSFGALLFERTVDLLAWVGSPSLWLLLFAKEEFRNDPGSTAPLRVTA